MITNTNKKNDNNWVTFFTKPQVIDENLTKLTTLLNKITQKKGKVFSIQYPDGCYKNPYIKANFFAGAILMVDELNRLVPNCVSIYEGSRTYVLKINNDKISELLKIFANGNKFNSFKKKMDEDIELQNNLTTLNVCLNSFVSSAMRFKTLAPNIVVQDPSSDDEKEKPCLKVDFQAYEGEVEAKVLTDNLNKLVKGCAELLPRVNDEYRRVKIKNEKVKSLLKKLKYEANPDHHALAEEIRIGYKQMAKDISNLCFEAVLTNSGNQSGKYIPPENCKMISSYIDPDGEGFIPKPT